jgi:FAD/FMN-containing dehydrogenase
MQRKLAMFEGCALAHPTPFLFYSLFNLYCRIILGAIFDGRVTLYIPDVYRISGIFHAIMKGLVSRMNAHRNETTKEFIPEGGMQRREFLALCAMGLLPGVLAACQDGSSSTAGANSTSTQAAQSTPTKQSGPTDADWAALAKSLRGTLVRPTSPQYATARQLFDPRYDSVHPAALAYCATPADVQTCLAFVRKFNLPFAPRSGGHNYNGYSTSTGLVIDVTRMHTVAVNTHTNTTTIGAGTRLVDVYNVLAQYGLVLPAGSCPTVGIAGLTLGGGVGVIGRKFGLTCDNLLSAQVVTANGRVLTCDAQHDSDLFWALRGGGGGNMGIATSFTFQAHPVTTLTLFTLAWSWSDAATVVDGWQRWAPQAPDEVWSNCLLLAQKDKSASPIVHVNGVYVGTEGPLDALLARLINTIGIAPTYRYVASPGILATMLYEAGCYNKTVPQCHLPSQDPNGQLVRDTSAVKSHYYVNTLSRQGINTLINAINARRASSLLGEGGIGMDAYGGAINRVASNATAFVHRNALFSSQFSASWNANDSASVVAANRSWLNSTWQAMRPYATGTSYQNYVDPDLSDWQHAYYGANLPRLQHVKAMYDPGNLFHFAQSIPL